MKISQNTNWLLLLLLIFTGQTLAVPLTTNYVDCEMDSMSEHNMTTMDMSSDMNMDCCDDCQCSDGLFVPNVYIAILDKNVNLFIDSTVISHEPQFINTQRSSSIYRPPILS